MVEDINHQAPSTEIELHITAQQVIRMLDRVAANRGYPLKMWIGTGQELVSLALAQWADEYGVQLEFIKMGKPGQNAFIKRFSRTFGQKSWIFICSEH